jgi:ABC-type uncharacterized transport system substrate-binding protein
LVLLLAVVVVAEPQQSKKIGGNVTGLSSLGPELITKRLEILSKVIPKLTRVGILMRPGLARDLVRSNRSKKSEQRRRR